MGSSSYISILYTVILLLRMWGRTVTRKNGKNSDNFLIQVFKVWKDIFRNPFCPKRKPYFHEKYILEI
jgi:hypothetical protein